jgi:hypothetical protein
MLQVRVHHDDCLRGGEPRHQRALMAETATRTPRTRTSADQRRRSHVRRAAIVDDDELEPSHRRIHDPRSRTKLEIAFLVVRWYHDGNHVVTPEQLRLLQLAMFVPAGV